MGLLLGQPGGLGSFFWCHCSLDIFDPGVQLLCNLATSLHGCCNVLGDDRYRHGGLSTAAAALSHVVRALPCSPTTPRVVGVDTGHLVVVGGLAPTHKTLAQEVADGRPVQAVVAGRPQVARSLALGEVFRVRPTLAHT